MVFPFGGHWANPAEYVDWGSPAPAGAGPVVEEHLDPRGLVGELTSGLGERSWPR